MHVTSNRKYIMLLESKIIILVEKHLNYKHLKKDISHSLDDDNFFSFVRLLYAVYQVITYLRKFLN